MVPILIPEGSPLDLSVLVTVLASFTIRIDTANSKVPT